MNKTQQQIKALQMERTMMVDMLTEIERMIGTKACRDFVSNAPEDSDHFIDATIKKLLELKVEEH